MSYDGWNTRSMQIRERSSEIAGQLHGVQKGFESTVAVTYGISIDELFQIAESEGVHLCTKCEHWQDLPVFCQKRDCPVKTDKDED